MAILGLEEKEFFASGHRACAGCGEALAIRHILKAAGIDTIVVMATGCMEVVSTPYPDTAWEIPWVHCAFENAASVASGVKASLNMKGNAHTNVIAIGGDGAMFDIGFGAISGAIERGHKILYIATDNEAYQNCLALDSLIMTKQGLKKITEVQVGDEVYALNQKTNELVLKKCTGVFNNGVKRVFEINTDSQTIKATGNHPFLVLQKNGRGDKNKLIWKNVEELTKGDQVVTLKKSFEGKPYAFSPISISKKGDYKVNKIREVNLPKQSSLELMKLLGLFVGDGWTRANKADLGFSIPEKDKARKEAISLIEKVFGVKPTTLTKNEVHLYSKNAVTFIESLGFGKGAKNKIIPSWVFTLTTQEKEEFIEGMMLSDGYKFGKSWRYLSASKELIRTLRLLLQTIETRVGKITIQKVKKGKFVVYRKLLKDSIYYSIAFSQRKGRKADYPSQYKFDNFLFKNKNFEMKKIRTIEKKGYESTLDLRVEGEHNFVANGLVVHNTGIQRSGATFPYAATTTSPNGKLIHGKQQPKKPLPFIIAAHGAKYVATASVANVFDLKNKVQKALKTEGPSFISVFVPCMPGWKIDSSATIDISKLAQDTHVYPLYEIEDGVLKMNYIPSEKKPVEQYLMVQGRFKHLTPDLVEKIQKYVDDRWTYLENNNGKKIFDTLF